MKGQFLGRLGIPHLPYPLHKLALLTIWHTGLGYCSVLRKALKTVPRRSKNNPEPNVYHEFSRHNPRWVSDLLHFYLTLHSVQSITSIEKQNKQTLCNAQNKVEHKSKATKNDYLRISRWTAILFYFLCKAVFLLRESLNLSSCILYLSFSRATTLLLMLPVHSVKCNVTILLFVLLLLAVLLCWLCTYCTASIIIIYDFR